MPYEVALEVVPHRIAMSSHCGPLIRSRRFHRGFSGIPQPRARSRHQTRHMSMKTESTHYQERLEDEMRPSAELEYAEAARTDLRAGWVGTATQSTVVPAVEVVIPVYNEERALDENIRRLHAYLHDWFPLPTRITIADNASIDSTWQIATALAEDLPDVRAIHLDVKGRGRALRTAWSLSDAAVVSYMDVDLSTGLSALLPLVAPLLSGHSDVAIGSRLRRGARVVRGPKREMISRGYNLILKMALGVGFSDAQCGFKAVRADRVHELLPEIEDNAWFFDTELLVLAERSGLRIHEVPVDWVDDPDSRVDIVSTAVADLKGVFRLLRSGWMGRRTQQTRSTRPALHG